MSAASRVIQSISPLQLQPAREFCTPSSGLFFVGSVLYLLPQTTFDLLSMQTLFGTSLTLADGMLTPAVSVTSAVAGIGLSVPSMNSNISAISVGFLVALFLAQRFGTAKLSFIFSPGMPPVSI